MNKRCLYGASMVVILITAFLSWRPALAVEVCDAGQGLGANLKCFFNDSGPLLFKSASSDISLKSAPGSHFVYVNLISPDHAGLTVTSNGILFDKNNNQLVSADGGTYSINVAGNASTASAANSAGYSTGLALVNGTLSPSNLASMNYGQLVVNNQDTNYWGSSSGLAVDGLSPTYYHSDQATGLSMASQLAFVRDGDSTAGFNQFLQFRFNDPDNQNRWGSWREVCDISNNCRNFINTLDDSNEGALMMYSDPDLLADSGLKVSGGALQMTAPSLASCSSLSTDASGLVQCGGSTTGITGSGTARYLSKWTSGSAIGNSVLYESAGGNIGLGTAIPGAKLQVNAATGAEGLRIVSASNYSPLNIRDSANSNDIFRVDQSGILQVGSIPWNKLTSFPTACSAGQFVSAIGSTLICATPADDGGYLADEAGITLIGSKTFSLKLDGMTLSTTTSGVKVNAIGSAQITDGTIANADISTSAAIADTKLATIATANKVSGSAVQLADGGGLANSNGLKVADLTYAKLGGVSGGQILTGGTAANNALTLQGNVGTGNTATAGSIYFNVGDSATVNAITILNNGNVGINRSNPSEKLQVAGNIDSYATSASIGFSVSDNFTPFGGSVTAHYGLTRGSLGANTVALSGYAGLGLFTNGAERIRVDFSGNFGIGTNSPNSKLDVNGNLNFNGSLKVGNVERMSISTTDSTGIVFKSNAGATWMTIKDNSGPEITIGDGSNSKLNVGTVDPIYTIGGKKYATYMSAMTGVKEETSGTLVLNKQSAGLFMAKLDFKNESEGSDIWLFGRTTNIVNNQEHFNQAACLLTPNFAGQVWYEKDWNSRSINIFAKPDNTNRDSVEMSYRLTAPRFDQASWTNYSSSDQGGFNLDKLLK